VRVGQLGLQLPDALLQLDHGLLQLDDPLDPGQVDAVLLAQPLDLAQQRHVPGAVAPPAAGGPARLDQAHPVVLAQRLRMHPGQPGGHRDDQHLRVGGLLDGDHELSHGPTCRSMCSRGAAGADAA
jgi:hypothetical protein